MPLDVQPPPAIYDFPYAGPRVELELPLDNVQLICRGMGLVTKVGDIFYGCSFKSPTACLVVIPKKDNRITLQDQWAIHRHEIGHCNGWPADHSVPR